MNRATIVCTLVSLQKKRNVSAAVFALLAAGALSAAWSRVTASQQAPAAPQKPSAARTIIVPRRLVAGQRATLAVLDIQGRLAPGVALELSGGVRLNTDSTGRAAFDVPANSKLLYAHIQTRPDRVSSVIVPPDATPERRLTVSNYPHVVALSDRFEISGSGFDGNADGNRATAAGKPALVLAASPLALVLMPEPGLPEGTSEFSAESSGQKAGPFPITFVSLEVSSAKHSLAANERGILNVRVRGSSDRLLIEARNLSPEIVALPHGIVQREISSGGPENAARFELEGLRPGPFSISVHLISPPAPPGGFRKH